MPTNNRTKRNRNQNEKKEKRENTQHCIVYKKITLRSVREEREPRGAKVEGWRRVESYIFLETAREKSRPLRGSCPRGHLSRAKESEPKRKQSQRGYEPKEAGRGGKKEREKERKKRKWKRRERISTWSTDATSVRTRGKWSQRRASSSRIIKDFRLFVADWVRSV